MPAKILVSTEDMPYADWLEYRKQGIGGSDASVVCGINRYKSPVELWMEKTQFLVTLHELPLESVAANQNGDVGSGIPGDGHVVLHLEHTLKAEHPALYKKYANKSSYRRFTIKAAS